MREMEALLQLNQVNTKLGWRGGVRRRVLFCAPFRCSTVFRAAPAEALVGGEAAAEIQAGGQGRVLRVVDGKLPIAVKYMTSDKSTAVRAEIRSVRCSHQRRHAVPPRTRIAHRCCCVE